MTRRKNRGYGEEIAKAVLAEVDRDSSEKVPLPRVQSWYSDWANPVRAREISRQWLSCGLEGALQDLPPDLVIRYFVEMAEDVGQLGTDKALERFVHKVLPPILSNEPPKCRMKKSNTV